MSKDERNFSLSLWDHKDNFLSLLKSSNSEIEGQTFNENFTENINGEKTLSFSIPMYIFNLDADEYHKFEKNNILWNYIKNEQKIRYIEYDEILNTPIRIEEFVLKEFSEERNGEEKIANCSCESLAVYELGKVGWGISFDTDYITDYELGYDENEESNCPDLLTLDYWLKKIFYKETNLGRVSNTTECTYLLQGLQLRNNEGYPISENYIEKKDGSREYEIISEPQCTTSVTSNEYIKYYNPFGWEWEVQATFENDPDKISVSTLYEDPVINKYIEKIPNYYEAQSYQKGINSNTEPVQLRKHPIPEEELDEWTYVTDVKKRLVVTERSNIFSIIQDLCEIFGIWAYFIYDYSEDGKIIHRKILFKTESIDENIKFDFSYGKNLQSCSRIINSNDLITKLIVPPVESTLVEGNLLSIQQATANPTGEDYLYNFDYFYELGTFTKEESFTTNSDEYKIKLHSGKIREINNKILNLQKFLAPLYDKQSQLQSDLTIQDSSKIGYMDNIQSIQNKIDAIPPNEQIINSWVKDKNQYNHVGPVKTYSTTTKDGKEYQYLDFGRDDVIASSFTMEIISCQIVDGEIISGTTRVFEIPSFIPKSFNYQSWNNGNEAIPESTSTPYFTDFIQDGNQVIYNYSDLGDHCFIKGIYFRNQDRGTYSRIRYQYAPLIYYYLLIQDYWEKIKKVQSEIDILGDSLIDINNKILTYELDLKKLLNTKKELILQFEKNYKPFIREGYWEPSEYQSQVNNKKFDTNNTSNFDGLFIRQYELKQLNLNDSPHKYSRYLKLQNLSNIDINSIEMTTDTVISGVTTRVPRYRGHDFEFYRQNNEDSLIIGISPDLVDKVEADLVSKYTEVSHLKYKTIDEISITTDSNWIKIDNSNNPVISDYFIYISNDNILTDTLEIYGNSITTDNKLEIYQDYNYNFESTAYDEDSNQRIDIKEWQNTSEKVYYDYSLKIQLKLTNNVNRFLVNNPRFIITYSEDSTLQYLFNDSVATSEKYAYPQVEYNISVIDLSSLNEYKLYKPKLGQKVPIWDVEMGFNGYEGFITSISYNLEQKENTEITIATYNTKFEDIFQKLTATMSDVSYNENKIYNAANSFENDGSIKTEVFQKSLEDNFNRIELGTNNDIIVDRESGITLKDQNSSNAVKLIGNGIFLTDNINSDNVQWKTGITGEGINANAITIGNIDTKQINIWNSSEGQIRFRWNEQGLFAYGDGTDLEEISTSTATSSDLDKLINYSTYVKFNQDGLEFTDGGKSALSLGWNGLNINTQNNSLVLNANNGLTLTEWINATTGINRLQLGKLDDGHIYGLKLKDTSGSTSFQSDSDGNLWLSKFINIGGYFDDSTTSSSFKPINATAGIIGITTNEPAYQMGIIRDTDNGDVILKSNPLRFWAGPQTKNDYLLNLSISIDDFYNKEGKENETNFWNSIHDKDPALAKFKVDSQGNIIASGVDVGGWIGAGKILRSSNFEAILRSGEYNKTVNNENINVPVFAIGKNSNSTDGSDYNFRVYQDGSLNIGNGNFIATSTGFITANNMNINGGSISLNGTSTEIAININDGVFRVTKDGGVTASAMNIVGGSISSAGININNKFIVSGTSGAVTAGDITITGSGNREWIIDSEEFQVSKEGYVGAGIIPEDERPVSFSTENYDFSVSDGDIRFKGNIYAYYGSEWWKGVDSEFIDIPLGDNQTQRYKVIQGIIVGKIIEDA